MIENSIEQQRINCRKNQIKKLKSLKDYLLRCYTNQTINGYKQKAVMDDLPQQIIIFIKEIDKTIETLEKIQESAKK